MYNLHLGFYVVKGDPMLLLLLSIDAGRGGGNRVFSLPNRTKPSRGIGMYTHNNKQQQQQQQNLRVRDFPFTLVYIYKEGYRYVIPRT